MGILDRDHYEGNILDQVADLERRLADLERRALTAQGDGSGLDADTVDGVDTPDHAKATSDDGQSIANITWQTIVFEDEVYDTNSEYNPATGVFTAKRSGFLQVTSAILYDNTTAWGATERAEIVVYVAGVQITRLDRETDFSGANIYVHCSGSATVQVDSGETVTVRAYQNSGGARALYSSIGNADQYNFVCFDWLF